MADDYEALASVLGDPARYDLNYGMDPLSKFGVVFRLQGALGPIVLVAAAIAFFGCGFLIQHYEDQLQEEPERALPGPLA